MKALVCEMCNSPHLVKKDGMYVCENCGTRYTVEEARKLMIEGPVDVSGSTVKVDTSNELANLYQIARRAKDDNNSENAAKYYDMILVKDPTSWEAAFYVVYFKAMDCTIAQIRSAAISVSNCEDSVLKLIRDYVPEANQKYAVAEVAIRSIHIAKTLAVIAEHNYEETDYTIKDKYTQEYIDRALAARDILYTCGSQIESIFGNQKYAMSYAVKAWKAGIDIHAGVIPYLANKSANWDTIAFYENKIGKYDLSYKKKAEKMLLEAEIAELKKTIASTPAGPTWGGFGIFIICAGAFLLLGCAAVAVDGSCTFDVCIFPLLLIALGVYLGKPKAQVTEQNRKILNDAKAQLAKKEAKLKELAK